MKKIFTIVILTFSINASAQTWQKNIGNNENFNPSCITRTSDNCFLIGGMKNNDGFILKCDSLGNFIWSNTYVITGNVFKINFIKEINNGNIIATGYVGNYEKNTVLKLSPTGSILFSKEGINGDIIESSSQNIILSWPLSMINYANGDTIFTKVWDKIAGFNKIIKLSDGNIAGLTYQGEFIGVIAVKFDQNLDTIWAKQIDFGSAGNINDIAELNDGNLLIGINHGSPTLRKIDSDGGLIWGITLNFSGATQFEIKKILESNDGGAYIGATIDAPGTGGTDLALIKVSNYGVIQWAKAYGSAFSETFADMIYSNDSNIVLLGKTNGFSLSYDNIYLVKVNQNGISGCNEVTIPVNSTSFGGYTASVSMNQINSGAINNNINFSVQNINLITSTLCVTNINEKKSDFAISIYPNPTDGNIIIDFGNNYTTMNGYTLKITNSLSQIVYTTPINTQSTTVDLSTWTGNGIYFVHLIDASSNTIDIRKIVLQ